MLSINFSVISKKTQAEKFAKELVLVCLQYKRKFSSLITNKSGSTYAMLGYIRRYSTSVMGDKTAEIILLMNIKIAEWEKNEKPVDRTYVYFFLNTHIATIDELKRRAIKLDHKWLTAFDPKVPGSKLTRKKIFNLPENEVNIFFFLDLLNANFLGKSYEKIR